VKLDLTLGATYLKNERCRFRVWAPRAGAVSVHILQPAEQLVPLTRKEHGYYDAVVEGVKPGSLYFYLLDGEKERPDPASRSQPHGVHGPSEVVDPDAFVWSDQCWTGRPQRELVFYELHVGTFTEEGTFDAATAHLDQIQELGVTAVQLMPVAQFPGGRNWGYDGVFPFAVQNSYGGPEGLRRLVDACHKRKMAVFLDVVYNHLGPEGNYLQEFAPYFTDRYQTPWGAAVNLDGPLSGEVRRFFIENALYWLEEFHIDGLRLDAVHAIFDMSALHFLEELNAAVHLSGERSGRRVYVIAESDLNNARLIRPRAVGGYGLDAQWCDDFQHSLHALLTGERTGYYADFGTLAHLCKAFENGYVYTGQYSTYRRRRHGNRTELCRPEQFVVFAQNHDQVGNRARGERLAALISFPALKLAAAVVILSPFLPLLFMGEEYGETAPFQYFTSHSEPALVKAVREGRRAEFDALEWKNGVPDPQDEETFIRSRLRRELLRQKRHKTLFEFYKNLIRLRRELPALANLDWEAVEITSSERERLLFIRRLSGDDEAWMAFSFNEAATTAVVPLPPGRWRKLLDSAEERWLGSGSSVPAEVVSPGEAALALSPLSCLILSRVKEACD